MSLMGRGRVAPAPGTPAPRVGIRGNLLAFPWLSFPPAPALCSGCWAMGSHQRHSSRRGVFSDSWGHQDSKYLDSVCFARVTEQGNEPEVQDPAMALSTCLILIELTSLSLSFLMCKLGALFDLPHKVVYYPLRICLMSEVIDFFICHRERIRTPHQILCGFGQVT